MVRVRADAYRGESMSQLNYSFDELMAEHDYATKIRHKDKTLHGGLLADGTYRPPRSLNRTPPSRRGGAA